VIKPESFPYLDALSKFLEENENINLEIVGHTDLHGTDEYNKQLSLERAKAVEKYLVEKGLDSRRFTVSGVGKSQPVVNRIGEGFDELNRRTEFKILKDDQ
jgi:outer membrane protein OmpA-like peptidoglycan-associated protein